MAFRLARVLEGYASARTAIPAAGCPGAVPGLGWGRRGQSRALARGGLPPARPEGRPPAQDAGGGRRRPHRREAGQAQDSGQRERSPAAGNAGGVRGRA